MKKVYLFDDLGNYTGEAVEEFGITYVNKTEMCPDPEFLNGKFIVKWDGETWNYLDVVESSKKSAIEIPDDTCEQQEETTFDDQRIQFVKQQAQEQFPYMWELFENKLKELGIIENINKGESNGK